MSAFQCPLATRDEGRYFKVTHQGRRPHGHRDPGPENRHHHGRLPDDVTLGAGEPLKNVPRSVTEMGDEVIELVEIADTPGTYRLTIRKGS